MKKQALIMIVIIVALAGVVAFMVMSKDKEDGATQQVTSSTDVKSSDQTTDQQANTNSGTASQATEIAIENFAYSPETITIKKGTTITWTNKDSVGHTVTGEDGGPDSDSLAQGESYSYTFNEAGSFSYFCKPHPNMKATVIVTE